MSSFFVVSEQNTEQTAVFNALIDYESGRHSTGSLTSTLTGWLLAHEIDPTGKSLDELRSLYRGAYFDSLQGHSSKL